MMHFIHVNWICGGFSGPFRPKNSVFSESRLAYLHMAMFARHHAVLETCHADITERSFQVLQMQVFNKVSSAEEEKIKSLQSVIKRVISPRLAVFDRNNSPHGDTLSHTVTNRLRSKETGVTRHTSKKNA